MATIVVDELITKLTYQHDAQTVKQAETAVKQLEATNKAAAESADALAAENRKLAEHTDALTRAQVDLSEQIAESTSKTDKLVAEQKALKEETKKAGNATDEQTKRLAELDAEIAQSRQATKDLREESQRLGREKQKVGLEARKVARAQKDVAQESRQTASAQRQLKDALNSTATSARDQSGAMSSLAERIKGAAGGELAADAIRAMGTAVVDLGKEIITTGANFESLRARLKTVEGSTEAAGDAFRMIQEFAKKTPFEVENITEAFTALRVRGVHPTTEMLTGLGDMTSSFGRDFKTMTDAIASTARGEFEPIRQFGVMVRKVGDNLDVTFKGQTTRIAMNNAAVTELIASYGKMTGIQGAMAEQSATTSGMFSNLKDTLSAFFDEIAQMGVLDEVKLMMVALSESMGGTDGLARVIADILIIALRTLRELFLSMPQETLVEFLQAIVSLVGMLAEKFVGVASEQASFSGAMFELVAALLEAIGTIQELVDRVQAIRDSFDAIPGPLDVLIGLLRVWGAILEFVAAKLEYLKTLLDPFLDRMENMANRLPTVNDLFSMLGSAVKGLASDFGLLNDDLAQTAARADSATDALLKLASTQAAGDYATKSVAELTAMRQAGDEKADAELKRRSDANEQREKQEGVEKAKKAKAGDTATRLDRLLDNPGRLSAKQLASIVAGEGMLGIDPKQAQRLRDKAQKEIDKRANKQTSDGKKAASKLNKSLLTADIDKQLDELAKAAGQRAAARAIQRSGGQLSEEEINDIELAERKAVKGRLARRYEETGELPPGLAMDLRQTAALPNIEDVGGRLAPPVITVNNTRIEVTGNTFTAEVNVAGGVSATPGQVADAVVTTAAPVTYQGLARAIQNQLTNER